MNFKKIVAIALTLLIVIPIGAGYALALDKEDRTTYDRDSGASISDTLFNHYSYTLVDSLDPGNNSRLTNASNGSATPAYASTSSVPSAYPVGGGQYGDITYGWKLVSGYYTLANPLGLGFISMYVDLGTTMTTGAVFKWAPGANVDLGSSVGFETLTISKLADGNLSVHFGKPNLSGGSTQTLGAYRYIHIVQDSVSDEVRVEGVTSWPAYGTAPTVLNSVSWSKIRIDDWGPTALWSQGDKAVYRVDLCKVLGDTYPSTRDFTLYPTQMFPETDLDIVINGADTYGTGLSICGTFYSVTDGKISVGGEDVRLKGATIRIIKDGANHDVSINGHTVAEDYAGTPSVHFWSDWSVSATAFKLTEGTEKVTVWHAGEFGLDKSGIAAVGLLVCGGLLVGLGMTGPRSGVKIGALLLICGGAAVVYLILI